MEEYKKYRIKDILTLYLKHIGKFSCYRDEIFHYMEDHPAYPSFASFHYALNRAGIESIAVYTSLEGLKNDIPKPAIVHLNEENGVFALLTGIDSQYAYIAQYGKEAKVELHDFETLFSGNVLAVDSDPERLTISRRMLFSGYISKFSKWIFPVLLLLSYLLLAEKTDFYGWAYRILWVGGLVLSILLFSKQMGFSDEWTERICTAGGRHTDCNSILASRGAKFLGVITWSEVGVIYFLTLLAGEWLLGFSLLHGFVLLASWVAFPYVFYSLYYQGIIAKVWCPLCLGVQLVFILQLILSIFVFWEEKEVRLGWIGFTGLFLLSLTISCAVFMIKSLLEKSRQGKFIEKYFRQMKYHPEVKEKMFTEEYIPTEEIRKVSFFPEEENQIVYVFSPLCAPCIRKIAFLLEMMENYEVGISFVFFNKDRTYGEDIPMIRYLIEKYLEAPEHFFSALKEYAENYPLSKRQLDHYKPHPAYMEEIEQIRISHDMWCRQNQIIATPTILFNNHKLSGFYTLEDITYILI